MIRLDILLAHLLLPAYPQVQIIQDASVIHQLHPHYQLLVLVQFIQEHIDIDHYYLKVLLPSYYLFLLPVNYRPAGTLQRRT